MTPALLVDALAVHRLTRLVTDDDITEPLRTAWETKAPPWLAPLATCRWCASIHIAIAAVTLRRLAPRAWDPLARALALSSTGTLLARLED